MRTPDQFGAVTPRRFITVLLARVGAPRIRRRSDSDGVERCTYAPDMTARRFVFPQAGDDLATLVARELPDLPDAAQQVLSWNLHLAARRSVGLLPSDVVFTEPPPAR